MNGFFSRWGVWILTVFAVLYYGQYYRAGLYPAAEGGVEAMVALRLIEGQRPIIDTFLGYNVFWFYPVVALFKIFGPSYTALRLFFFVLCLLTGLMSFRLVRLTTGSAAAGFLAGALVILIPGQMFRNYMAFLVVLNMTSFFSAWLLPARSFRERLFWIAATGLTLAAAWLIRVDVGFFLTFVWLGLLVCFVMKPGSLMENARLAAMGAAGAATVFMGMHLPVYLDASHRGFADEFAGQYRQWPSVINTQAGKVIRSLGSAVTRMSPPGISHPANNAREQPSPPAVQSAPKPALVESRHEEQKKSAEPATLTRRSFMSGSTRDKMLAINIYLPIAVAAMLAVGSVVGLLIARQRRDGRLREQSLTVLAALACSLTLFPQYFFWRPDMVHLSEFMVPMTLTAVMAITHALAGWSRCGKGWRMVLGTVLLGSVLMIVLYYINACQSQSSGGIAASLNKRFEFHAANGVDVKLTRDEFEDASAIYRIITAVSAPGEYLICYPYNPEINFMTDRPSYEYNFYVDNAVMSSDRFHAETLKKIAAYRPVAFVITDWEVNNTPESKFSNWAAKTYRHIIQNYRLAYRCGNVEVYVRPDRFEKIPPDLKDGGRF